MRIRRLECNRDCLRFDDYFIKLLTLKRPPAHTFSNMLRDLYRVQADFVAVSEWNACDMVKTVSSIRSQRRHWHNTKLSLWSHLGPIGPLNGNSF